MRWPVFGAVVRSEYTDFGALRPPTEFTKMWTTHGGIDLSGGPGVVVAACPSVVVLSSTKTSYNPGIVIAMGRAIYNGAMIYIYIVYGHLSPDAVTMCPRGRYLAPGDTLGKWASQGEIRSGATTNKTNPEMGPHLHFELRNDIWGMTGPQKMALYWDPAEFLYNDTLKRGKRAKTRYPWGEKSYGFVHLF